jgi:hypothetical protein
MSAVEASMGNVETSMGALEAYEATFRGLGGRPWGGAIRFCDHLWSQNGMVCPFKRRRGRPKPLRDPFKAQGALT